MFYSKRVHNFRMYHLCLKIAHKLKLFKNKQEEKYTICDNTILYIAKNVKLLKNQCLGFGFAYLKSNCKNKIKIGFSMVTCLKTGYLSDLPYMLIMRKNKNYKTKRK